MSEPMTCPYCAATMAEVPLGPIVIDVCGRCKTRWFDHAELEEAATQLVRVGAARFGSPAPDSEGPTVRCPREGKDRAVEPYRALGVEFGRCASCRGILFTDRQWHSLERSFNTKEPLLTRDAGEFALLEVLEFLVIIGRALIH